MCLSCLFRSALCCLIFCSVLQASNSNAAFEEGRAQVFDLRTDNDAQYSSITQLSNTGHFDLELLNNSSMTLLGEALYFTANKAGDVNSNVLYTHDIASGNTHEVRASTTSSAFIEPEILGKYKGALFFKSYLFEEGINDENIWRIDTQGAAPEVLGRFSRLKILSSNDENLYVTSDNGEAGKVALWTFTDEGELILVSNDIPDQGRGVDEKIFVTDSYIYLRSSANLLVRLTRETGSVAQYESGVVPGPMIEFDNALCFPLFVDDSNDVAQLYCMNGFQNAQPIAGTEGIYDNFFATDEGLLFAKLGVDERLTFHRYADGKVTDIPMGKVEIRVQRSNIRKNIGLNLIDGVLYGLSDTHLFSFDVASRAYQEYVDISGLNVRGDNDLLYTPDPPLLFDQGQLVFYAFDPTSNELMGYRTYALTPGANAAQILFDGSELTHVGAVLDGIAYGWAYADRVGTELFKYDLSTRQRTLLADLHQGTHSSNPQRPYLFNESMYWLADASRDGDQTHALWRISRTQESPEQVMTLLLPGGTDETLLSSDTAVAFATLEGQLYLLAVSTATGDQSMVYTSLYKLDTENGTYQQERVFEVEGGHSDSMEKLLVSLNDKLFFTAANIGEQESLWAYRAEDGQFSQLPVALGGGVYSLPQDLFAFRDTLLFTAEDQQGINQLWRYDESTEAAVPITTMTQAQEVATPASFMIIDGTLLFRVARGAGEGVELWYINDIEARAAKFDQALPTIVDMRSDSGKYLLSAVTMSETQMDVGKVIDACSWWQYSNDTQTFEQLGEFSNPGLNTCGGRDSMASYNGKVYVAPTYFDQRQFLSPLLVIDPFTGISRAGGYEVGELGVARRVPEEMTVFDGALWLSGYAVDNQIKLGKELIRYTDLRPVIGQGESLTVELDEDTESDVFPLQATDADSDMLEWRVLTEPQNGDLLLDVNNLLASGKYIPNPEYVGQDEAVIQVSDGEHTDAIKVTFSVQAVTPPPTPNPPPAPTSPDSGGGSVQWGALLLLSWIAWTRAVYQANISISSTLVSIRERIFGMERGSWKEREKR